MSKDMFVLIDVRNNRDSDDPPFQKVADDFLKNFYGCRRPEFSGYIVYEGKRVPFWKVCCGLDAILDEQSRQQLLPLGYIGKII